MFTPGQAQLNTGEWRPFVISRNKAALQASPRRNQNKVDIVIMNGGRKRFKTCKVDFSFDWLERGTGGRMQKGV